MRAKISVGEGSCSQPSLEGAAVWQITSFKAARADSIPAVGPRD